MEANKLFVILVTNVIRNKFFNDRVSVYDLAIELDDFFGKFDITPEELQGVILSTLPEAKENILKEVEALLEQIETSLSRILSEEEILKDMTEEEIQNLLQTPTSEVEELQSLPPVIQNNLLAKLETLADLVGMSLIEVGRYKRIGASRARAVAYVIEGMGLHLGMEVDKYLDKGTQENSE